MISPARGHPPGSTAAPPTGRFRLPAAPLPNRHRTAWGSSVSPLSRLARAVSIENWGVARTAILLEAGLSFLGLGDPAVPSWGYMLNTAQKFLRTAWWMALFPGLGIFVTVLGFNLVGDGLNNALNPRLRQD